ncbi:hypothetical protein BDF19DRAFT_415275 [Syncephalis fuscata]|nr:hypothetical protein BDF19DRAFT_415275 [Syncephalis fuscata]
MSTATNLQGLGLDSSQIGWLLTATNVAAFLGQWFIYVPVHYRCGSLWLYRYALIFYIPFSLLLPLLGLMVHRSLIPSDTGNSVTGGYWHMLLILIAIRAIVNVFAVTCLQMMVVNVGLKINALGVVNGIANSSSSLALALGPIISAVIWDWSTNASGLLYHGALAWLFLTVVALSSLLFSIWLPSELSPRQLLAEDAD